MENIRIYKLKNLHFWVEFLLVFSIGGAFTYFNSLYLFLITSTLLLILAFKNPKYFIKISLTWIIVRFSFIYHYTYISPRSSDIGYATRGDLFLNFIRFSSSDNYFIQHLPKVFFIASFFYILNIFLMKIRPIFVNDKKMTYVAIFIFITLLSSIANLGFNVKLLIFLYRFLFPIIIFYYVYEARLLFDREEILNYLIFLFFEIQLLFTIIQNLNKLKQGIWSFGDDAIGTFVFPYCQFSSVLIAIALFFFLIKFASSRKVEYLLKSIVGFIAILSASVLFFTILLTIYLFFTIVLFTHLKIISAKKSIRIIFATIIIFVVPILYVSKNIDNYYGGDYFISKMEQNLNKDILQIGKLYSFINLWNMLEETEKYFLGVGPGNFLTNVGERYNSPLTQKYGSWNVLSGTLGSGDWVENNFVGLVGEIGLLGWFFYFSFYVNIALNFYKNYLKHNKRMIYLSLFLTLLFFMIYSFTTNYFETIENVIPLLALCGLYYESVNA